MHFGIDIKNEQTFRQKFAIEIVSDHSPIHSEAFHRIFMNRIACILHSKPNLRLLTDQMANSLPNSSDFMVKIDIIRGAINENLIIIGITFSDCVSCTRTPLKQRMLNEYNEFWKLYSKITPIDLTLEIIIDSGVGPINVFLNKLLKDIPEVSLRHSNIKRV